MGVGISDWRLARTVSMLGQLGVVSGTALDLMLARRLQLGDLQGDVRRAMNNFPEPDIAKRVLERFYISKGKLPDAPFKAMPMHSINPSKTLIELTILASFVEVNLAKEGHSNPVGINLLEKIQLPILPTLFGAMLAGVDYVLMGAGVPRYIPRVLDSLANGSMVALKLYVHGAGPNEDHLYHFNPVDYVDVRNIKLKRPQFVPIVSSSTLAMTLAKKSEGSVDGFVVEGYTAGGHNAPPRGVLQLNPQGEPIYSARDIPDLGKIRELGLPFWLAGSYASSNKLKEALEAGANGVQVGTAFAFCKESGMHSHLKRAVLEKVRDNNISIFTDPLASPTGFPFKIVRLGNTVSEEAVYAKRQKLCDLGYLRTIYRKADGSLGYRCPGEPVSDYISKGGVEPETVGRKCICNGLTATVGLGQFHTQSGEFEKPLVTAGNDIASIRRFLKQQECAYSAEDVIRDILAE